ncbi:head maturation protease, ClpP-related [uncultured Clostridium sp.]|uniref:head maturation protease, ClpP-related n=1 Tax=uncultured Clostridium sp. TaxID=59620 RepID=UPI0025F7BA9C|nr:head maturation protease, ClpP-related [uncultured Clostridium sp.]
MNRTLFSIRQQTIKPDALDIYIYDDVEGDSYNWWTGEKTESETSANHIKQVLESNQNATEINLYINSYGGEVKEGLGIYNQLKRHPAQVNVYIDGFACSIASVIAMAGDKVVMGTNALMMIHHASMCAWGNAEELRKAANDLEVIDQASCSSYISKAGEKLDEDTLKQLLDNQTWLNANQCLEYGLIDEIAGQEDKTIEAAQQRFRQSVQAQIMQIKEPQIKVPEQFEKQKSNYEMLRQKFMKKEGIK